MEKEKRKKNKIRMTSLAQWHHVQLLKKMEKQSLMVYRFVMKKLLRDIQADLKKEKLAKSDNPFDKLPPGWTGEVPKIELDLDGIIAKKIDRHLRALRWVMLGNYAGKAAKTAAEEIGIMGKIVPGLLQSAYLQSIDAHRMHHFDVIGEEATEISRKLMKASMEQINSRANRFMKQLAEQIKVGVIESLSLAVKEINMTNMNNVLKEAHDILPKDGPELAIEEAAKKAVTDMSSRKIAREFNKVSTKMENNWDRTVRTELANSSAVGTHQAVYEIYGDKEDDVKIAWVEMEDEKVCQFCKQASKNPDGSFKIYKISDFLPSGYNYGKKRSEWKLQIPPAHPRCFVDDMDVLTDEGWKKWPDVTGNEKFLSVDLKSGDAEWVKAKQLVKQHYNGPIHWYHNRYANFAVTPNHSHIVKFRKKLKGRKDAGYWKLVDDCDLPKHDFSFLATIPDWKGLRPTTIPIGSHFFDTSDFMKFMGMYLSEGSISKPPRGKWQIKISQTKYYDAFIAVARKLFDTVWAGNDAFYIPLDDDFLIDYFRQLGHSHEKYIPSDLKELDGEYLLDFLQYHALGDGNFKLNTPLLGSKTESWSTTHYTSSDRLASDLGELMLKTGSRPSYGKDRPRLCNHKNGTYLTKRPCWRISNCNSIAYNINRMSREVINYEGTIYDVELEKNHTLVVRRGNSVVISGNCRCDLVYIPKGFEITKDGTLQIKV